MAVEHGLAEGSAGPLRTKASPFMPGQGVIKLGQEIPEVGTVLLPAAPADDQNKNTAPLSPPVGDLVEGEACIAMAVEHGPA